MPDDFSFTLLLNNSPWTNEDCEHDAELPASLNYPPLLVGTCEHAWGSSSSTSGPALSNEELDNSFYFARVGLIASLLCLTLRREQGLVNPDSKGGPVPSQGAIPSWIFIPAIHISSTSVYVLGHFPVEVEDSSGLRAVHFHSRIIDSIPFIFDPSMSEADLALNRLRLVTALFTLQRHSVRLSGLWDGVVWPASVLEEDMAEISREFGIPEDSVRVPHVNSKIDSDEEEDQKVGN